ncbi:enolase C-terminal domain-like protein [Thermodesulfobacteriota bacterium]
MTQVKAFELYALDIPFRRPFRHAAADRHTSESLLLKCVTGSGKVGYGECLPRPYVTGETRDGSIELLRSRILSRMLDQEFSGFDHVKFFLETCDGKAPEEWVPPGVPQNAAWAAVDLALLDAFGHEFDMPVRLGPEEGPDSSLRYSFIFSADRGPKAFLTLALFFLLGFRQAKIKVEKEIPNIFSRIALRLLSAFGEPRVDVNMAWDMPGAIKAMQHLSRCGVQSFEQPIKADDINGMSRLIQETGLDVIADESFTDRDSLETLITSRACTGVNVRISKCGGLVAAHKRCKRALESGLKVQIGAHVGETSLLSAAQVLLAAGVKGATYIEGCFGQYLLQEDPFRPVITFGYGGRPPELPEGPGLGVRIDEEILGRWGVKKHTIGSF